MKCVYKINCNEGTVFGVYGKKIGHLTKKGYFKLSNKINGEIYIHRLIYKTFYHNEFLKKGWDIDHINNIRNDNRIENLRLVNHEYNASIQINKNKTSKYRGVDYDKLTGKWRATCNHKTLGRFKSEEDACDAYWDYYQKYVFLYSG